MKRSKISLIALAIAGAGLSATPVFACRQDMRAIKNNFVSSAIDKAVKEKTLPDLQRLVSVEVPEFGSTKNEGGCLAAFAGSIILRFKATNDDGFGHAQKTTTPEVRVKITVAADGSVSTKNL